MFDTPLFAALPGHAQLWVYAADRRLTASEQAAFLDRLNAFLPGWQSHGRPVVGEAAVLYDRLVLVAAYIPNGDISGCGIDASVSAVEAAGRDLGLSWLPPLSVLYRDEQGTVQSLARPDFREAVRAGTITAATPVFDPSITTLAALRAGQFERPAGDSWHARIFRIPQPTA